MVDGVHHFMYIALKVCQVFGVGAIWILKHVGFIEYLHIGLTRRAALGTCRETTADKHW